VPWFIELMLQSATQTSDEGKEAPASAWLEGHCRGPPSYSRSPSLRRLH
jgi:hypothetical protein